MSCIKFEASQGDLLGHALDLRIVDKSSLSPRPAKIILTHRDEIRDATVCLEGFVSPSGEGSSLGAIGGYQFASRDYLSYIGDSTVCRPIYCVSASRGREDVMERQVNFIKTLQHRVELECGVGIL
ncbi:hypothetical protein BJ165DRAFT_1529779 [Panaeolus papilionaceus]|nr:hypothetical protein BJ165DRAFT_1529779 [Panaeolus papilionaceus]